MADLGSLWIGDRLGAIERASVASFLRHGDRLTLFAYAPVADVPPGVALRDAAAILPGPILRHPGTGSPALHSDLFRYAMIGQTDLIWVDLDIIALRSFDFPSPWVMGYETATELNGAVLRLPKDSVTLQELRRLRTDTVGYPPSFSPFRRWKYRLRTLGRGQPITRWAWGMAGPRALTHLARASGEIAHALPVSAFYAIPFTQAHRFAQPGALSRSDLPPDAVAVHLWGKELRAHLTVDFGGEVPDGSFLARAMAGAI